MARNLVVVESPAKAKTLKKYLGKNFDILASYGHVRDLVPKEGAVDPENNFSMKYQVIEKNAKHVEAICSNLKTAEALYLATDPDREGEAIAWHLYELIKQRKALAKKPLYRVAFHEITKTAVQHAIANARELSLDLVNAQQTRRALDYLVGFKLSPLLWKKIKRGLSAGRVQSPALRLIVEREEEIEKFESQEYWSIEADLEKNNKFIAKLIEYSNEKLKQFSITNDKQAIKIKEDLLKEANGYLTVAKITKSKRKRNPTAPFTTSTLQQESVRKLGFTARRTMSTAQQLYEGIDIGDGAVGLITYMRTDSVTLATEAVEDIRAFIGEKYEKNNVPDSPRIYKTKAKNAQEAHEAIRPTSIRIEPESIKHKLSNEQYKLYNLIWQRTISSQMIHATINQVAIDFSCGTGNTFRANGSTIENPGFIQVYQEGYDEKQPEEQKQTMLPHMEEGDKVPLQQIRTEQHFTEPPPRYSEASLVKALEEYGIGRPSTYASIISTLQQREYAELITKRFVPTDVGRIVNKFLTSYFTNYVDYEFTAKLEDHLDEIARGEKEWLPILSNFWQPFKTLLTEVEQKVHRKDVTQEQLEEACPKCGQFLSIRLGKRGRFIGCTAYPNCDYTRSLDDKEQNAPEAEIVEGRTCPNCNNNLVIKSGKYGKFIGCSSYPKCKFIESLEQTTDTKVLCPSCKKGNLFKKRTRYKSFFYACKCYPDCKYAVKYPPTATTCPNCNWPIMVTKTTKRKGEELICPQKDCGFIQDDEEK